MSIAYESLVTRRCVRNFSDRPLERATVEQLVAAGARAATARNEQPWIFVAVTEAQRRRQLKALCPQNGPFIDVAPLTIAVFCADTKYWLEDGSAATQNLLNAAHALGFGAVWVAGEKKDYAGAVRELLKVPDNFRLVSLVVVGHPAKVPPLTPRKPLADVLYWETFK